jgi:hypothetical protein
VRRRSRRRDRDERVAHDGDVAELASNFFERCLTCGAARDELFEAFVDVEAQLVVDRAGGTPEVVRFGPL